MRPDLSELRIFFFRSVSFERSICVVGTGKMGNYFGVPVYIWMKVPPGEQGLPQTGDRLELPPHEDPIEGHSTDVPNPDPECDVDPCAKVITNVLENAQISIDPDSKALASAAEVAPTYVKLQSTALQQTHACEQPVVLEQARFSHQYLPAVKLANVAVQDQTGGSAVVSNVFAQTADAAVVAAPPQTIQTEVEPVEEEQVSKAVEQEGDAVLRVKYADKPIECSESEVYSSPVRKMTAQHIAEPNQILRTAERVGTFDLTIKASSDNNNLASDSIESLPSQSHIKPEPPPVPKDIPISVVKQNAILKPDSNVKAWNLPIKLASTDAKTPPAAKSGRDLFGKLVLVSRPTTPKADGTAKQDGLRWPDKPKDGSKSDEKPGRKAEQVQVNKPVDQKPPKVVYPSS